VVQASTKARIAIIGQAPGARVHASGIPWDDPSGKRLRSWLQMTDEEFYNPDLVALVPMGFCYPGKDKSGDLPPRSECAPLWHETLIQSMPGIRITLLFGQYAQRHYLGDRIRKNLTETVRAWESYLPEFLPLPHPSPRNGIWLRKHEWFEEEVVPALQQIVLPLIEEAG
jgi:uracil-DNA glycosylase